MGAVVRGLIVVVGILYVVGGLFLIVAIPSIWTIGLWCLGNGVFIAVVLSRERPRYGSTSRRQATSDGVQRSAGTESPALDPRFQATAEAFIDPTSGDRITVYIDPSTGERRYVPSP